MANPVNVYFVVREVFFLSRRRFKAYKLDRRFDSRSPPAVQPDDIVFEFAAELRSYKISSVSITRDLFRSSVVSLGSMYQSTKQGYRWMAAERFAATTWSNMSSHLGLRLPKVGCCRR
jgi:hypothetical protein